MERDEQLKISHEMVIYILGQHGVFLNRQFPKQIDKASRETGISQQKLVEWAKKTLAESADRFIVERKI